MLQVATRLFIEGQQVGRDGDFVDYYPTVQDGVEDTKRYFEGQGYAIESIDVEELKRFATCAETIPTIVVKLKRLAAAGDGDS
jgi:hypothetical protein